MNPPVTAATPTVRTSKRIRLDDDFVSMYADRQPDWGPLGWITYKRTYARWADKAQTRREEWYETVRRVVEGNLELDPRPRTAGVLAELMAEGQEMFDSIWNLLWTPPGRGLWISGTDYAKTHGDALVNCWVVAVRPGRYDKGEPVKPSYPFCMAMDLLMKGGGVGFSVTKENVIQMPAIKNPARLHIVCDPHHPNFRELSAENIPQANHTYVRVDDTREGWWDALRVTIDSHYKYPRERHIVIDVSDIRAAGEQIRGFGGTAAGPGPLVELLRAVNGVLNDACGRQLTAVECTDVMNMVGRCVVAGNVRRSAELALGSGDDLGFIAMKTNQNETKPRWASNNSIAIDSLFEDFERIASGIALNGEPGIVNLEAHRMYGRMADPQITDERQHGIEGTNPCGEIGLATGECCNLAEVFPARVEAAGYDMDRVLQLALRYTKRITCGNFDWYETRKIVGDNRRVGVSLSGIADWMLSRNLKTYDDLAPTLDAMYKTVREADAEYSALLDVPLSVATTTVKPSGTVSLLSGASPGLHFHYAPYFIRRIRFQDQDPLVDMLRECGFPVEPDTQTPNTVVAEFPVRAPNADSKNFRSADDLTLEEQFANQATLQRWWADNSVSATLTFKPSEKRQIARLLREYRDQLKSTSLLPYTEHSYKQAPYEPITAAQYEERCAAVKAWPHEMADRLTETKRKEFEVMDNDDCATGACPIR